MPRGLDCDALNHRSQIFDLSLPHQLEQPADGELFEVRSGSVELARRPVTVLLVNHDHGRVVLGSVRDVADTARLLARGEGQLAQNIANVFTVFRGESHSYDKAAHCAS